MNKRTKKMPGTDLEAPLWAAGYCRVAGVDEAGRGPLAGPLFVAAVVVAQDSPLIDGVDDSKKLTPARREELYAAIMRAHEVSVLSATPVEIDSGGIRNVTLRLMAECCALLGTDYALVDGRDRIAVDCEQSPVVGGDAICYSIACASIVAKVTRDRVMHELARLYPLFGFEVHKGYGTSAHMSAIEKYGLTAEHRRTFCRRFL